MTRAAADSEPRPARVSGALQNPIHEDPEAGREVLESVVAQEGTDLVALIQGVQGALGYLPRDVLEELARQTGLPLARVYGVATFYSGFSLVPRGRRVVKVCHGTACHVRGAERITEAVSLALGVAEGETTADREFTLETAACVGCCSLAPVIQVGQEAYGRLDTVAATAVVAELKGEAGP